jgi:hypothetical protein
VTSPSDDMPHDHFGQHSGLLPIGVVRCRWRGAVHEHGQARVERNDQHTADLNRHSFDKDNSYGTGLGGLVLPMVNCNWSSEPPAAAWRASSAM